MTAARLGLRRVGDLAEKWEMMLVVLTEALMEENVVDRMAFLLEEMRVG